MGCISVSGAEEDENEKQYKKLPRNKTNNSNQK
jgi:hypothetical protein